MDFETNAWTDVSLRPTPGHGHEIKNKNPIIKKTAWNPQRAAEDSRRQGLSFAVDIKQYHVVSAPQMGGNIDFLPVVQIPELISHDQGRAGVYSGAIINSFISKLD